MSRRSTRRHTQGPDSPLSERIGRIGLLALFALVPLVHNADLYAFALLPKRLLVQVAVLIIALFWVLDHRAGRVPSLRTTPLNLPAVCYLLISTLALSQALNPVSGLLSLSHQMVFVLLFCTVVGAFRVDAIPQLLRIGAGVGILVSIIGILEGRGFNLAWFPVSNGRPSATFAYRNFAASYLIMNIPLALALSVRSKNLKDFCLGALSTGLMVVFLVYTRTRGAWAGLVGAALVTVFLLGYARWRWNTSFGLSQQVVRTRPGLAIVSALLILTVSLSWLPPDIASQQSRAIDEKKAELITALASVTTPGADRGRLDMWRHTREMIKDHPLLGVGPGNWQYVYPRYDGGDMLRPGSAPEHPHNDLLWIASEIGLPGLAVYLWLLCAAAATGIRILRRSEKPEHALYAAAFGASLLAVLGHSLFSFPRERVETSFLFWTGLGILALLDPSRPTAAERSNAQLRRYILYLIPVLLFFSTWLTIRHIRFDTHYLKALHYYYKGGDFKGGDFRSILREATAALNHGPFDSQAFYLQGKGHQSIGLIQQARADCLRGLRYHPHSIELLGDLGKYYAMLDSLERAERCFQEALDLSPEHFQIYNDLGGVYQKRGDLDAAIAAYQKVLERDNQSIATYNNLGLTYMAAGRTDDAIRTYLQALEQAPKELWIYHNLGDAYYEKGVKDPAALPLALGAYDRFLKLFKLLKGPPTQSNTARSRVAEIRSRLSGGSP